MEMPGRKWQGTADAYRYGMNGQEKEKEIFGGANSAEHWMYDSRIGRRWELDPVVFEWQSSYATFDNNPIYYSDPLGAASGTNNPGGGKQGLDGRGKDITLKQPDAPQPTETPIHLDPKVITHIPKTSPEPSLRTPGNSNNAEFRQASPKMYEQPTWMTNTRAFLRGIDQFNPVSQGWDAISHLMFGTDKYGNRTNNVDFLYSAIAAIPFVGLESGVARSAKPFMVGTYDELKAFSNAELHAHHVGQAAIFEKLIPGYNRQFAPAILVPAIGHTTSKGVLGIVKRTVDLTLTPRTVLARDALELRRVFNVPNSQIQKLIEMNKKMYPKAFVK